MAKPKTEQPKGEKQAKVEANGKIPHKGWTGTLMCGPISIPCFLYTAARGVRVSFNMLHDACSKQLKQQYVCPSCCIIELLKPTSIGDQMYKKGDRVEVTGDVADSMITSKVATLVPEIAVKVDRDHTIKGFEATKGKFITVSKEDIDRQKPESSDMMQIDRFVPASQINPLYFESSYYLAPDDSIKTKAFSILREGLVVTKRAAVAKVTKSSNENLVFLLPFDGIDGSKGLICYTSYFADEIQPMRYPDLTDVTEAEKKSVVGFIEALSEDLDMTLYRDDYRHNLNGLMETLLKGEVPVAVEHKPVPKAQSDNLIEMFDAGAEVAKRKKKAA